MIQKLSDWLARLSGIRADGAAFLFGVAAALALPPYFLLPVLWIAVPGLLILIGNAPGWRKAARRGWWFGFGHHLLGLYWITEAILFEAAKFWWLVPLAVPAIAAILAVFIAVAAGLARCAAPGLPRVLVLAGAWTLADIARQFTLTGFPWNPWGSMWAFPGTLGTIMVQPAAWGSVHLLTLLTILVAAIPALRGRARWSAIAILMLWPVLGWLRLGQAPAGPPVSVALIQGDIAQGQKWDRRFVAQTFTTYLDLTRQAASAMATAYPQTVRVIIWPETASPYLLVQDPAAREAIAKAAQGATVLAGTVRFGRDGRPRNSLVAILPDAKLDGVYDKWHLVPGGEYQPAWLPLGIQLVPGGGFVPGPGPKTMHVIGLPAFGPLICYESIFPAEIVDEKDRPSWLVNITNDAWFGNSSGPRQHFTAARLRAVEEGLPLMRAANTGISALFDPYGRVIRRLGLQKRGVVMGRLTGFLPRTLFSEMGLIDPIAIAVLIFGLGIAGSRLRLLRRKKSTDFKNIAAP
ncbi:MAG: apolipoprotein N-acyltransferase [Rhodospirillales bacterium]|nr:apolipoprotein N-acyltransferase [Rhodospirillales bacterium]